MGCVSLLLALKLLPFWDEMVGKITGPVLLALTTLGVFLISWGYDILFETLWNGETPGKRMLGLRVIKEGGYPVDFRAVLVRNLLRAVDTLPGVPMVPIYGLGLIAVLANTRYQRLGDMAAGTLVVRHGRRDPAVLYIVGQGNAEVLRLLDTTVISQLSRLTREEYRMVQHFLERRNGIPALLRGEFALRLAAPLMEKFQYQPPKTGVDSERWLEELDLAYRNRTLGVTPSPSVPQVSPVSVTPSTAPDRKW